MRRSTPLAGLVLLTSLGLFATGGCIGFEGSGDGLATPGEGGEGNEAAGYPVDGPLSLSEPGIDEVGGQAAPFSLTASDGTGLVLASVTSDTAIEDPVALTQLHMVFENPEDRVLEGRFAITLPEGASMSRFAMKIGPEWQEAEVVEKQRARVTYEEFLHRRKDPALLEQAAGNEFAVRIFPIAAKERREIVITYAEPVGARTPYRLRLAGLPKVGRIDARVHAGGKAVGSYEATNEAPKGDLVVPVARWGGGDATAMRAGDAVVARVRIPGGETAAAPIKSAVILFDTSASRALDLDRSLAALRTVVSGLDPATPLRVAAFDQEVAPIYDGPAGRFDDVPIARIRSRGALGASDLSGALAWAGATAKRAGGSDHRVILLTDGVATAGGTKGEELAAAARRLSDEGVARIDAVAVGGLRDSALLASMTRGALPNAGVIVGVEEGGASISRKLGQKALPNLELAVDGASWSYPRSVEGAQPGDEIAVYANLPADRPVVVRVGGAEVRPRLHEGPLPLVQRAVATAKIQSLEEAHGLPEEARRAAIIELSTKHRVVSGHTSLLVLETDQDYARFGIDRTAKVDVLVVQNGGIAVASHARAGAGGGKVAGRDEGTMGNPPTRATNQRFAVAGPSEDARGVDASPGPAASADPLSARGNMWGDEIGDSFGQGGLGLSGIGEGGGGRGDGTGLGNVGTLGHGAGTGTGQGFGSGSGRLGGAHRTRPPAVRMGATSVSGRLPPEVIQRIVRQNFGRFRACYENGLRQNPNLMGRVNVQFTIGRDGAVSNVRDGGSDLPSAEVRTCVARAFTTLSFPQPESGIVQVTYPIVFSPEGGSAQPMVTAPWNGGTRGTPSAPTLPRPELGDPLVGPNRPEDAYEGKLREVMAKVHSGKGADALSIAEAWRKSSPGDVLALVALGEAAEATQNAQLAARAYGSILELWSYRVDMRRFAGERLERLASQAAMRLASDAFEGAVEDRPDHPSSHRLHAYSLLKLGRPGEAFAALEKAIAKNYAAGRFAGVSKILEEDVGIAGAAWVAKDPSKRADVEKRLQAIGSALPTGPSLRFVLVWETDASDVDLHVVDGKNEHAYYSNPGLSSGGRLVADVTNGYGPEGFIVPTAPAQRTYPYKLRVHYYARGAMGFGMGKVEVVEHDGKGGLTFEDRPFVMMKDRAMVDLGEVRAPKAAEVAQKTASKG